MQNERLSKNLMGQSAEPSSSDWRRFSSLGSSRLASGIRLSIGQLVKGRHRSIQDITWASSGWARTYCYEYGTKVG